MSATATPVTGLPAAESLAAVIHELSLSSDVAEVMRVVRTAARAFTGADGATFILRDGDQCFYADEDAIGPLWKGQRFPMTACISGWAMRNRQPAVIADIYADDRIPWEAYRPTFVQSLAMVPVRTASPIGAIGAYWASRHEASAEELRILRTLADGASVAIQNVELNAELRRRVEAAEAAVRARDEFLVLVAHELRTPLATLLARVETIAKHGTDPVARTRADAALRSGRRMATRIDDLLGVALLSVGSVTLSPERFSLAAVARAVAEDMGADAAQRGCTVSVAVDGDSEGTWDRGRLEIVLTNLIANAVEFAGTAIEISVEGRTDDVVVTVRDHGPGIPEGQVEHIFTRFGRAASARNHGGLGLGLYIARSIAEAHGGTLTARNVPDGGASFILTLPRSTQGAATARSERPASDAA